MTETYLWNLHFHKTFVIRLKYVISHVSIKWIFFVLGALITHAPWLIIYHNHTGRILPNAWPSAQMIANSLFLQVAIAKPSYTYFWSFLKFSPLLIVGLVYGTGTLVTLILAWISDYFSKDSSANIDNDDKQLDINTFKLLKQKVRVAVVTLWPMSFIIGHTIIGLCGAGYQIRLILPAIPAAALLSGIAISNLSEISYPVVCILVGYSCCHFLFYAVMFAPMYADLKYSIFDFVSIIISTPYDAALVQQHFNSVLEFLKHFGLRLN
jgi:hypothetical protein